MKLMNLDIRKAGTAMEYIYDTVDRTLATIDPTTIERETVGHALQHMFQAHRHFSVCKVRECAKLCNVVIPKERMKIYDTMHCINWNEMDPEYRGKLVAMVMDDFRDVLNPQVEDVYSEAVAIQSN